MHRILFLDIDGVMRPINDPAPGFALSEGPVLRLNRIVEETGCSIVISSTWRQKLSLEQIQGIFQQYGFSYPKSIIDLTPDLGDVPRGEEIVSWLKSYSDVERYAVLDDCDDLDACSGHVVQTRALIGLTDTAAENIISLLIGSVS